VLLLVTGCERSDTRQPAPATGGAAASLARRLANEQAQAVYHCQPFVVEQATVWTNRHWVWHDRRGFGQGDIEATVTLAPDLSTQNVQVSFLDSRPRDSAF